jgi:UDP:flavonoid glycosyltransferase YjiC (YdhE family)
VRILFAFAGSSGHVEPLVPIAAAARAAGHDVAFAGRPAALEPLAALGSTVFPTEAPRTKPRARIPLQDVDVERERRVFRQGFADRIARSKADVLPAVIAEWRPDAIVCDETDFGSMIAAERLGLPYATVLVIAARTLAEPELVASTLDAVRAEHGLAPDPDLDMLSRHLVLVPFPPGYRDPVSPLPPSAAAFRPHAAHRAEARGTPLVYFTLGTEFNVEAGDLFSRAVAGLARLPVEVVVTVGRDLDPAELGPQPPHVRVERFVPQAELLPRASVVVSHGGSGSVLGALAHGVPMVLLPMGADQPYNAARCEELGVARTLDVISASSDDIRVAAEAVLSDPSYVVAAGRWRDEFAALPGPEHAVVLLEQLSKSPD